jgi:hypothetical protein
MRKDLSDIAGLVLGVLMIVAFAFCGIPIASLMGQVTLPSYGGQSGIDAFVDYASCLLPVISILVLGPVFFMASQRNRSEYNDAPKSITKAFLFLLSLVFCVLLAMFLYRVG